MIYYGYKSFKLYVYDYVRKEIIIVVNLFREKLTHFEFNNKYLRPHQRLAEKGEELDYGAQREIMLTAEPFGNFAWTFAEFLG